jgi:hypothetical protein
MDCAKMAITVKPNLDKPYPDDPRWSPWTRWVEPRRAARTTWRSPSASTSRKEHPMAREPQRREQPAPLGAAIVAVERALKARAKVLDEQAQAMMDDEGRTPVSELNAGIRHILASEFRSLAAELAHW